MKSDTPADAAHQERLQQELEEARKGWRCFHCDELFIDKAEALEHFGEVIDDDPLCKIKADEGGLAGEVRRIHEECAALATERNSYENDARLYHETISELQRTFGPDVTSAFMAWLKFEAQQGATEAAEASLATVTKEQHDAEKEAATLFQGLLRPEEPQDKHAMAMSFLRLWANSYLLKGNYWDVPQTMGSALTHVIDILEEKTNSLTKERDDARIRAEAAEAKADSLAKERDEQAEMLKGVVDHHTAEVQVLKKERAAYRRAAAQMHNGLVGHLNAGAFRADLAEDGVRLFDEAEALLGECRDDDGEEIRSYKGKCEAAETQVEALTAELGLARAAGSRDLNLRLQEANNQLAASLASVTKEHDEAQQRCRQLEADAFAQYQMNNPLMLRAEASEKARDEALANGLAVAARLAFVCGSDIPDTERAARAVLVQRIDAAEKERDEARQQRDEWRSVLVPEGGAFGPRVAKDLLHAAADRLDETTRRMESAEAEVSRLTALLAQGWQPIETAPKDGAFIIGLMADGEIHRTHWCEKYDPHTWASPAGFYHYPTHWMSLPPPPRVEGDS